MEIRDNELKDIVEFVKGTPRAIQAYGSLVEHFIEQRYNIKQEIAINRQRNEKPTQWQEYNDYCEECKQEAKRILGLEVSDND